MKAKTFTILGIVILGLVVVFFAFSGNSDEVTNSDTNNPTQLPGDSQETNQEDSDDLSGEDNSGDDMDDPGNGPPENIQDNMMDDKPLWLSAELTDVVSGESFSIGQFEQPVLLETFAVWCPKCKAQQDDIVDFHMEEGFSEDDVVSISLNVDAGEDADLVKNHAESNGFEWRFAVSPSDVTQSLVDEFGPGIVSAPSVPMVVICPDGTFEKLPTGNKNVEELKEAVAFCG